MDDIRLVGKGITLVLAQQEGSFEPDGLYLEVTEYGEVLRELYDYDV